LLQGKDANQYQKLEKEMEENDQKLEAERKKEHTHKEKKHRTSIPPPELTITEDEYFKFEQEYLHIGRPQKLEEEDKAYTATVAMVPKFPLTVEELVQLLDIAAPHHRMVSKLKEFVEKSLPAGFPVKLEMSVFPTVTATVTFNHFTHRTVDANLFDLPSDYKLRPRTRFRRGRGRAKMSGVSNSP